MSSLNKVMLIGRLGKDPELRYTQGGQPVCSMSIATDESYYPKDGGQKVEKTEWHRIVIWGKLAETAANNLSKGRLVYVEGKLETRKWQDQGGQDRYTTEIKAGRIQFLDPKGEGQGQSQGRGQGQPSGGGQGRQPVGRREPNHFPPDGDDLGPSFPSDVGGMDDVPF